MKGIDEIRWCRSTENPGLFQWFVHRSPPTELVYWVNWSKIWKVTPFFNGDGNDPTDNAKGVRDLLWRYYYQTVAASSQPELNQNVITLGSGTDGPKPPPRKKPRNDTLVVTSVHTESVRQPVQPAHPAFDGTFPVQVVEFFRVKVGDLSVRKVLQTIRALLDFCKSDHRIKRFLDSSHPTSAWKTHPQGVKLELVEGRQAPAEEVFISTLEMHRRVLRLEQLASVLGQALYNAARMPQSANRAAALQAADFKDLTFCLGAGCGIHGEGQTFWPSREAQVEGWRALPDWPLACWGSTQSHLSDMLEWMRANREDSFRRLYLVVDELSWAFPIICQLVVLWKQSGTTRPTAAQVIDSVGGMLSIRASVIEQERVLLLRYGANLTSYCRFLERMCGVWHVEGISQGMRLSDSGNGGVCAIVSDAQQHLSGAQQQAKVIADIANATNGRKKQVPCVCRCFSCLTLF